MLSIETAVGGENDACAELERNEKLTSQNKIKNNVLLTENLDVE